VNLKDAKQQRPAEKTVTKGQTTFLGMLSGMPASELPEGYSAKNWNLIDFMRYSEGRPGTRQYTTTAKPAGLMRARAEHEREGLVVWQYGATVYVTNKAIGAFTEVTNLSDRTPSDLAGMMVPNDVDMILASPAGGTEETPTGGLFRIVLDDPNGLYYMWRVNGGNPIVRLTDINEAVNRQYGYRGIYSCIQIQSDSYHDHRTTDDAEISWETGTILVPNDDRDYGEYFFTTPIDYRNDWPNAHMVGRFTVPDNEYAETHYGYYRTENIGTNSNGVSPSAQGQGNRYDHVIWVDDIPVAKAITANRVGNTVTVGIGAVEVGDVGCFLFNAAGGSDYIHTFTNPGLFTVSGTGTLGAGAVNWAIGRGRVFEGNQVGVLVTRTAGNNLVAGDVGKRIFWADGTYTILTAVNVGAQTATAGWAAGHGQQAFTMAPLAGNFSRCWNDTLQDQGGGAAVPSIEDRAGCGSDVYIPRRFFRPVPDGDIIAIGGGYAIHAKRDESRYRYSQVGDKRYTLGYHRIVDQEERLDGTLRHALILPSIAILVMANKTFVVQLTSAFDAGRSVIGEVVFILPKALEVDGKVGVYFWQSIVYKGTNKLIAVTNEPAVRYFADNRWSKENLAIDPQTGQDAITKEYLKRIDPFYGCVATYTESDGYIVWFYRWVDDVSDDVILDTGGDELGTGDDVWNDTGGGALVDDDVIHDTGGTHGT